MSIITPVEKIVLFKKSADEQQNEGVVVRPEKSSM